MPDLTRRVPVIHAVTSDSIVTRPGFMTQASAIMRSLGSRGAVHLRARALSAAKLHEIAASLAVLQGATDCWLVVNDRVDVALATGARGAQLTSRSMSVSHARIAAPQLLLGASVRTMDEAVAAAHDGASWLVAGNVFETPSHPGVPGRGLSFLDDAAKKTKLPCIGIGGIKPEHVRVLRAAGVYGVAAISGIWNAHDAEQAAIDYLSAYDGDSGSR
jgi:thiamine-phosphate diphosphorylase